MSTSHTIRDYIDIHYGLPGHEAKERELEIRFGTRRKNERNEEKKTTKIQFDKVIQYLKALGFTSRNEEGQYLLKIHSELETINNHELELRSQIIRDDQGKIKANAHKNK